MSEEEKKAIEYLKARLYGNEGCKFIDVVQTDLRIFLNLVEKQQKEIEELKKPKYIIDCETNKITKLSNDFISKDKIREKIDKYRKKSEKLHSQELWHEPEDSIKDFKYNHYLEAYKELLEEN